MRFNEGMNADIGILADIHGNLPALEAALSFLQERHVDQILFLGDLITDGACPAQCLVRIRSLQTVFPCRVIRGNREEYILARRGGGMRQWHYGSSASGSLLYTYDCLREEDFAWLEQLDNHGVLVIPGLPPLAYCHGSMEHTGTLLEAGSPEAREELENTPYPIIAAGHTHRQGTICLNGRKIVNPGSLGVPAGSGGRCQLAILHGDGNGWREELVQLEYDKQKAVRQMEEAHLFERAGMWAQAVKATVLYGADPYQDLIHTAEEISRQHGGCGVWADIEEEYAREAGRRLHLI